jgi:transporter family-2 protein
MGPWLTFGLLVAGQQIVSVTLEHYNVLVTQPHPISFLRVVGILLVAGGVMVIRMFQATIHKPAGLLASPSQGHPRTP